MTHNYIPSPEEVTAKPMKHLVVRALVFFAVALLATISPGKLLAQAPTINTFSPAIGAVGTLVTVNGVNLSAPTAFTIGGQNAIVVSNTGNILVAMVMPGAATGAVSITTAGGTASGNGNFALMPTPFPSVQQGTKLVATSSTSVADQGWSVALSADGNTAIVGGISDNSGTGAAWIYTRSAGDWAQQAKLVGTGAVGAASQGRSVSLSADGNTALVGGPTDNSNVGAAWVYTRNGGVWTQQGSKLLASDYSGHAELGFSVSLSADGHSAVIGGDTDNSGIGATWIYTRSGGIWAQQGLKLVGSLSVGNAVQGFSVSMSADGNTAIAGGPGDNKDAGAAWVYTNIGGTWTQQGSKLVGTGNVGAAFQGQSVSLSADGNTALVGGGQDNNAAGAAWVYTRSAGAWTQQGSKLTDNDGTGAGVAGWSVFLSADGNTAIAGGYGDNSYLGAAWVYTNSGGVWAQRGLKLAGTGVTGTESFQGYAVALSADGSTAMVGGPYDNSQQGAAWVYTVASSNANLSALALSAGTLSPAFASGTKSYTVSVTNAALSLTVTPATANINATVTVNNIKVTSGTASPPISLNEGATTKIIVEVTAQNGNKQSYLIAVTRAPSTNAKLSKLGPGIGGLTPAFASSTTNYTDNVSNATATITLKPVSSDANATIKVNGTAVASGTTTAPIALTEGAQTVISTVVTAQNGTTTKTYTLTVTRAPSTNANLSKLGPSIGGLTPAFSAATTSYTISTANATASMKLTPVSNDANATIKVNGITVTSGTVFGPIALAPGPNNITTVVTAQDGTTTKTYTLTVTRAASGADSYDPITIGTGISVTKPIEAPTLDDDVIVVHQGVSPNGDGINDFLQIDNISQYPNNKLMIMNRNGQLIYETQGYDNASKVFDGHSNKNGQMQLPGTYFYQLDYPANGILKHKTGFIVLKY
jgi:gliding motility-associated-like protein